VSRVYSALKRVPLTSAELQTLRAHFTNCKDKGRRVRLKVGVLCRCFEVRHGLVLQRGPRKGDGRIKTLNRNSPNARQHSSSNDQYIFARRPTKNQKESSLLSSQHCKDVAILGRDKGRWKMAMDFCLPKLTSLRNASLRSSTLPKKLCITATSH
jgi:hypothetical protein